jgi:homoserine O-acetyltransferase
MDFFRAALSVAIVLTSFATSAADYPAPKQSEWIARDFKFHTGETMPELKLHYATVGEPSGQPVIVLHGSGESAASMLTPTFAGELFGPASRWMPQSTTSSSPTASATANRPSPPTP